MDNRAHEQKEKSKNCQHFLDISGEIVQSARMYSLHVGGLGLSPDTKWSPAHSEPQHTVRYAPLQKKRKKIIFSIISHERNICETCKLLKQMTIQSGKIQGVNRSLIHHKHGFQWAQLHWNLFNAFHIFIYMHIYTRSRYSHTYVFPETLGQYCQLVCSLLYSKTSSNTNTEVAGKKL